MRPTAVVVAAETAFAIDPDATIDITAPPVLAERPGVAEPLPDQSASDAWTPPLPPPKVTARSPRPLAHQPRRSPVVTLIKALVLFGALLAAGVVVREMFFATPDDDSHASVPTGARGRETKQ